MNLKRSDWYLPQEVIVLLGMVFFFVPVLLASSALMFLSSADSAQLFSLGLAAGLCGVVLLFFARLPLYRQRRFLTFGPRELDQLHRRLYWSAYLFVIASLIFLGVVCFKSRAPI